MIEDQIKPTSPTKLFTQTSEASSKKKYTLSKRKQFLPSKIFESGICSKGNQMGNEISEEIYKEDFVSTGYKSLVTKRSSTHKKRGETSERTSFVRPFGFNLSNIQEEKKAMYHNSNNTSEFTLNIRNINIEQNNIMNNGIFGQSLGNIFRPKKKILSTEELVLEKIEKEKLEFEKLKRINKENIERLFPNSSYTATGNGNQGSLLCKKRDELSLNREFNQPGKEEMINNLPNLLNELNSTDKSSVFSSSLKLNFEDEYMSVTDDLCRLSVINSPPREDSTYSPVSNSLFNPIYSSKQEKERERQKKKEDKQKENKRQSALNKMDTSIFDKNDTFTNTKSNSILQMTPTSQEIFLGYSDRNFFQTN